jgi:hypothetical protein
MSFEITTAFVEQFGANIDLLSQQKDSRFGGKVREETQTGETQFFEQVGATEVEEATSRHDDTPRMDTPHARRQVTLRTFRWADLIDNADKVRMLIDPASTYAQSAMTSMNRKRDLLIIQAALGTAKTGKAGGTSIVLPSTQKIVHGSAGLTIAKLLSAKEILDENEVDEEIKRYIAVTAKQVSDLLNTTEVKSSDYNTVKALAMGQLNSFLGFEFIRSEQLTEDSTPDRQVIAWAEDGILISRGEGGTVTRVSERDDKNYSVQVFREETFGATRMEEKKVVEIACEE